MQEKKEVEVKRETAQKEADERKILASGGKPLKKKTNDEDITAQFDAQDDEDVVF